MRIKIIADILYIFCEINIDTKKMNSVRLIRIWNVLIFFNLFLLLLSMLNKNIKTPNANNVILKLVFGDLKNSSFELYRLINSPILKSDISALIGIDSLPNIDADRKIIDNKNK